MSPTSLDAISSEVKLPTPLKLPKAYDTMRIKEGIAYADFAFQGTELTPSPLRQHTIPLYKNIYTHSIQLNKTFNRDYDSDLIGYVKSIWLWELMRFEGNYGSPNACTS
jgi:hypothetical protein